MSRKIWWNGNILDESEARVSIYDESLMLGSQVFEMTRSFNKEQFKLKEHIKRLFDGLKILQIKLKYSENVIYESCMEVISNNSFLEDDEHRLLICVSRGLLGIYSEVGIVEPNVIISDFPLRWTVKGMNELFSNGINAVIPSQRTIPAKYLDPKIKNRSRLHYLKANMEVSNYKGDNNWALLLDDDGFITEGTGANFFIIKDQEVITPEPRNILRGISRQYIFKLCEELGIDCIERNIEPYDVYTADGAFFTATPFCMLPVTSLNSINIGSSHVFEDLIDHWGDNVGVNIIEQIKKWNKSDKKIDGVSPYNFKV